MRFIMILLTFCAINSLVFAEDSIESKKKIDMPKLEKECEAKKYESCFNLGAHYMQSAFFSDNETEESKVQKRSKGIEYYTKACNGNYMKACWSLAAAYELGIGVEQDKKKAIELYTKACNAKNYYADACKSLAYVYLQGDGVRQDLIKAEELLKKYFRGTKDNGLYWLGLADLAPEYYKSKNYKKALELFKESCKHGLALSCYDAGVLYFNGEGARQDYKLAKEYYGKACDLGYQDGCDKYKELNQMGH